ncbi:MAG: hypothetical protein ACI9BO_001379 [Zhongshania sp.]
MQDQDKETKKPGLLAIIGSITSAAFGGQGRAALIANVTSAMASFVIT